MPTAPSPEPDVLAEVAALAPTRLDIADPGWPGRRAELLDRITDSAAAPSRRMWVPLTAAAAGLVLAGGLAVARPWSAPPTPAGPATISTSASTPADALAAAAAAQPSLVWPAGQALHRRLRQTAYGDATPVTIDTYIDHDLAHRRERITRPGAAAPDPAADTDTSWMPRITRAHVDTQPTDTPGVLRLLGTLDPGRPAFMTARAMFIQTPPASPEQRAALIRALGTMPGVSVAAGTTADARRTTVFSFRYDDNTYELAFDPATARLIEWARRGTTSDGQRSDVVTTVTAEDIVPAAQIP